MRSSFFRDADRARLVNATCVDRDNRRCVQENIFNTVVVGAAAEGVSPEIDVRTQKDGMALFKDNNTQRMTRVDKDITGMWRLSREACFHGNNNI